MRIQRSASVYVAALAASISASYAGPCSPEIIQIEKALVALIEAKAGAAQAPESTAAKMHRQPTPGSIAAAELKLGLISPEQFNAVKAAMSRAREADGAGNRSACEQALADVKRLLDSASAQTNDARR